MVTTPSTANLVLALSATPQSIAIGNGVTFALNVQNLGLAAASQFVVTLMLPPGLEFVSASPQCSNNGEAVTCTSSSLQAGAAWTPLVIARAKALGTLTAAASLSTGGASQTTSINVVQVRSRGVRH